MDIPGATAPSPLFSQEVSEQLDELLYELGLAVVKARVLLADEHVDTLYAHSMAMASAIGILAKTTESAVKEQYERTIPLFRLTQEIREAEEMANNPFARILNFADLDGEEEENGSGPYL